MTKKQQVSINEQGVLTVNYPTIGKVFTTDLSKYGQEIHLAAAHHGFKQKFGDAASGGTPAEKYAMVQRIHAGLLNGDWELTGERDTSTIVIEAVCNLKKKKFADVQKVVEKNPDRIAEWRSNVQVKAEIARIRAERAAKAADDSEEDIEINL